MAEHLELGGLDLFWKNKPELPIANDENKQLEESLKHKKAEIEKLRAVLENNINKGKYVENYVNDLTRNLSYKVQILNSKKQELDFEAHTKKVINREMSRLNQEIGIAQSEIKYLKNRQNERKAAIEKQLEKRENLKSAIQWDEDTLLQYLEKSTQLEKDNLALVKYTAEDDSRMNELELAVERLNTEAYERKASLEDANTELVIVETELDRLQDEFRAAYRERVGLIDNWEKVIKQIEIRNTDIGNVSEQISQLQESEKELQHQLREQTALLTSESQRNDRLEGVIAEKDNIATRLRNESKLVEKREEDLKAELSTVRNVLNSLLYQKKLQESRLQNIDSQISNRSEKLVKLKEDNRQLETTIDTLSKETYQAEHYIKELEKLLEIETSRSDKIQKEFDLISRDVLAADHQINELNMREKFIETRNKNVQAEIRALDSKIAKIDQARIKQESEIYEAESNFEKLRRRFHKMSGEVDEEDRRRLEQERSVLVAALEEKKAAHKMLSEEVQHMTDRLTVSLKDLESNRKQHSDLEEKIKFLEFYITNTQKSLQCCVSRKQELLVQECLEKFQKKKYKKLLNSRNKSVAALKKSQLEFETLMREKTDDLKNLNDLLTVELRTEQDECGALKGKLRELMSRRDKLRSRYDVILESMGVSDPTENVEAELLIKAEVDKKDLLNERDDLISSVVKKEEELSAFQNTVWLVNVANEQFRQAIYPAGTNTTDCEALRASTAQLESTNIELHLRFSELKNLESTLSDKEDRLGLETSTCERLRDVVEDRDAEKAALENDLRELRDKVQRADRKRRTEDGVEEDIKVHLLREIRRTVSDLLFSTVETNPVITEKVEELFKEASLPLPARVRSSGSIRSGLRSRLSSGRSTPTSSVASSRSDVRTPTVVKLGDSLLA